MAMRPVLQSYRYLLRTNKQVFASDPHAIQHSLQCIRDEYRKNANVSDPKAVGALLPPTPHSHDRHDTLNCQKNSWRTRTRRGNLQRRT